MQELLKKLQNLEDRQKTYVIFGTSGFLVFIISLFWLNYLSHSLLLNQRTETATDKNSSFGQIFQAGSTVLGTETKKQFEIGKNFFQKIIETKNSFEVGSDSPS